jgi:hypothetical protein
MMYLHIHPIASDAVGDYGNRTSNDVLHPEHGRVNVKTAQQALTAHGLPSWKFQIDGVAQSCDHAYFIGLDAQRKKVERAWLVPVSHLPARLKVMTPASKEYVSGFEVPDVDVLLLDRKLQALLADASRTAPLPVVDTTASVEVEYDRIVLGKIGEAIYRRLHPDSHHESAVHPTATYDFQDPDGTQVNVRVRRLASRDSGPDRWTFFRSPKCTATEYYFIGVDRAASIVQGVYRIPANAMPEHGLSVSVSGSPKWDEYRVPLDLPASIGTFVDVPDFSATHVEIAGITATSLGRMSEGERDNLIRRALPYHRTLGFPYPAIPTDTQLLADLKSLASFQVEGKTIPIHSTGLGLCSAYMPHRFDTRNSDADFSAKGAFYDDDRCIRALRFCLKGARPGLTPGHLRNVLTALNRTPNCFRPSVAKVLVDAYCPKGGVVFDPCAGWGGRLVGTLSSGRKYVGIDSSEQTHACLYRLGFRVCSVSGLDLAAVRVIHSKIQAADLSGVSADFAMTSPPFWTRELYDGTQDDISVADWREDFLRPMFRRVSEVLQPGSHFAVHIADIRHGGHTVPLERFVLEDGTASGFVLAETWRMSKGSFGKQDANRTDPIFVFRKSHAAKR